jgi:tetratricopeptide (TPR) repeat protein
MENMKINFDKIYDKVTDSNIKQAGLIDAKIPKNIISPEEKELCIFLYTIFQYYLEKAVALINTNIKEDPEKKEKGKNILVSLLNSSFLNNFKSNKIISSCLNGLLNYYLGLYQFEIEELTECEKYYLKSLDHFNTLPVFIKIRYVNIYQQIYNNLGIVFSNKGDFKKGLQYFGKAEQMYKMFCELSSFNITNDFNAFMQNCSKDRSNDSCTDNLEFFNFFIDGGLDKKTLEKNYTMTIFYYAQAFTKLEFKKKAIKYCSLTLKRQIESNGIDLKDIIMNCNNLAEFYMDNQYFAQAEYVLLAALEILPKNEKDEEEYRAGVHLHLGKYFLERLKFAVRQTKEQLWISENEELHSVVNKRIVTFNTLNISWPKIEDVKDIEQAKLLFRLSNTQFKKALSYYVLDGYVTDHININKSISQLYKYLTFFETDNNRIFLMLDRRIGLLEPIITQINPKSYIVQWQVNKYLI